MPEESLRKCCTHVRQRPADLKVRVATIQLDVWLATRGQSAMWKDSRSYQDYWLLNCHCIIAEISIVLIVDGFSSLNYYLSLTTQCWHTYKYHFYGEGLTFEPSFQVDELRLDYNFYVCQTSLTLHNNALTQICHGNS